MLLAYSTTGCHIVPVPECWIPVLPVADRYSATCGAELPLRSRRQQSGVGRQDRPDIGDVLASIDIPDPFDGQVLCDRIAALAEGRIVSVGPIQDVLASGHPWVTAYFKGKRSRVAQPARM